MASKYIVAPGNERGGAASHITAFAEALAGGGQAADFLFVVLGDGPLLSTLETTGVPIRVLAGGIRTVFRQLVALMKQSDATSLWHAHGPRMNVLTHFAAQAAKRNWTSTIHSNIYNDFLANRLKSFVLPRLNRYCLRRTVGVFVGNPEFSAFVPQKPAFYVPNAVICKDLPEPREAYRSRLRELLGVPGDTFLFGVAARLDPVKDISTIVKAFADIPDKKAHLAVAGDGTERAALCTLANELGLSKRVHFLGFIDWADRFYAGLDVHVSASLSEGASPFFILEAGCRGVPNIGSDIAGVRNLLQDNETGLCFPVGDVQSLTHQMMVLRQRPELGSRLADAFIRQTLPRFTPDVMLSAYMQGYEEMTSKRGG